jgi:hypothetical protein
MKISVGSGRAVASEGVTGAALSKRRQMGCDGSPLVPLLATLADHRFSDRHHDDRYQLRKMALTCVDASGIEQATPRL